MKIHVKVPATTANLGPGFDALGLALNLWNEADFVATDEKILDMQKLLASTEGIWVEPASAAGLSGLALEIASGKLNPKGKRVVAICTGHGMKDPDIITKDMPKPQIVAPKLEALEELILG